MAKKLSFFEKYLKPSFERKLVEKAAKDEAKRAKSSKQDESKKEKVEKSQYEKAHLILSISARNAYDEKKQETPTPAEAAKPDESKKVEGDGDTCFVGIILKQKTPATTEKPVEQNPVKTQETIDVKLVEKQETPKPVETVKPAENPEKPAEPEKQETPIHTEPAKQETVESGKPTEPETPAEPEKPVAPQMIIKEEQQRKLSKAEKKALRKKQKREEAEKKASSPTTAESSTTATEKIGEAVAEGIEAGEFNVVHTNPYIELLQSKVKSWDSQGNALDENGNIVVDGNGNVVKVDPVAGMILMAMPQYPQQQTATA